MLLLVLAPALAACGDQPASPPGNDDTQTTATTDTSDDVESTSTTTAANNESPMGIDLSQVDPCALLTREEAEATMGPLDWKPYSHPLNDPAFKVKCEFDPPYVGDTPEKSLALRLIAPNGWQADYDDLQGEGASLIALQEVGLEGEAALRYDDAQRAQLPALCGLALPCTITMNGSDWLTLTMIST
jgi:hypothetical protein